MLLFGPLRLKLSKYSQGESLLKNASATIYNQILPNRAAAPAAATPPLSAAEWDLPAQTAKPHDCAGIPGGGLCGCESWLWPVTEYVPFPEHLSNSMNKHRLRWLQNSVCHREVVFFEKFISQKVTTVTHSTTWLTLVKVPRLPLEKYPRTISLYFEVSTNSFSKFCVPKLVIREYLYQEHDQITQQDACKSLGKCQTIIIIESTLV